jgi:hypothetical protein
MVATTMTFAVHMMISGVMHADAQTASLPLLVAESQNGGLRGSQWTPVASAQGGQFVSFRLDFDKEFSSEVEAVLGAKFLADNKDRIDDITKALRPTFAAVDKNEYGKLGQTAVRYVVHRLFVARNGWLMKGLDPAGQQFNASSPVQVLTGKTSPQVQDLFEKRLEAQGFGLQELSVFATLLEVLISEETSERLLKLYDTMGIADDSHLSEARTIDTMELYMTQYILGRQIEASTGKELVTLKDSMSTFYSFWNETQKLVRETAKEVLGSSDKNSFADIRIVLVKIAERFSKRQNDECSIMKQKLIKLETDEKGCVPISNFYRDIVHTEGSDWQFGESIDYLKINGIIDEHDPSNMRVMIANYMNGPANCIATSQYYAVCCIDECEALMGHIESQVGAPKAGPNELAALIAALPSSTVSANRTLPPSQMHRLQRIAERHDGFIPLHGRLFMQWMHMVYPRECAYPHLSGTTAPLTPDQWMDSDKDPSATKDEMEKYVNASRLNTTVQTSQGDQGQCGRWIDEEELFVGGQTTRRLALHELETDAQTWLAASSVALLCILAAATLAVISAFRSLKHTLCSPWTTERPLMMV